MSKLHYRFRLSQGNHIGDNSKTQPLLLSYNDTPMRLPWSSTPRTTEETTNSYSHKYKLYGLIQYIILQVVIEQSQIHLMININKMKRIHRK